MNLGPLVKFNAAASAAHVVYHTKLALLNAEDDRIKEAAKQLLRQKLEIALQIEALEIEQMRAVLAAHPEIGDAHIEIDCASDGYRVLRADKVPGAPEWAQELAREFARESQPTKR